MNSTPLNRKRIPVETSGQNLSSAGHSLSKVAMLVEETLDWCAEPEWNTSEQANEPGGIGRGINIPVNP